VFLPPGTCSTILTCPTCFLSCDPSNFGYHGHYFSNKLGVNVAYAVINYNSSERSMTSLVGHEIMEAATNPVGDGYYSDHPNNSDIGNNNPNNGAKPEIGDLCNGFGAWFGTPQTQAQGQQGWRQDLCQCNFQYQDAQPTGCGIIQSARGLRRGNAFYSCDGRFAVQLQNDGNLVVVNYSVNPPQPLWNTQTWNTNAEVAHMQGDGNFFVVGANNNVFFNVGAYDPGQGSTYAPAGTLPSNTTYWPGAYLSMQNDGNLVLYYQPNSGGPQAHWATNTCCH
jgi:hypothetical protein